MRSGAVALLISLFGLILAYCRNDMGPPVATPAPMSSQLLAYLPFNGNANDSSGMGRNGILHGGTWVADRLGNPMSALSLNGQSDFVEIPDDSLLRPPAITVTAWVSVSAFSSVKTGGDPDAQYIVLMTPSGTNFDPYDLQFGDASRVFTAVVASAEKAQVFASSLSGSVELNKWYFLALTADTLALRLYVNGILVAQNPTGFHLNYSSPPTPIGIGSRIQPWNGYFNGKVDEVRIYGRILTGDEILSLYDRSKAGL